MMVICSTYFGFCTFFLMLPFLEGYSHVCHTYFMDSGHLPISRLQFVGTCEAKPSQGRYSSGKTFWSEWNQRPRCELEALAFLGGDATHFVCLSFCPFGYRRRDLSLFFDIYNFFMTPQGCSPNPWNSRCDPFRGWPFCDGIAQSLQPKPA